MERFEEDDIELKPEGESFLGKIKGLFENKKRRYLFMILFILPFVIAIGIFGYITYKEAKSILSLATGTTEINTDHEIPSMGYVLRDNATDIQFEYFTELKTTIEAGEYDNATVAGMVCKNFVADFYTWSNKQGQYDVGGLYYVYDDELADGTDYKENLFLQARDTFYKYLNTYINEYGAENLLEVESVTVVNASKSSTNVLISEHVANKQDENGDWYDYRENNEYETFNVKCSWTYKASEKFPTSKYPTSMNFLVAKFGERFEILAISEKTIEVPTDVPFNE